MGPLGRGMNLSQGILQKMERKGGKGGVDLKEYLKYLIYLATVIHVMTHHVALNDVDDKPNTVM